VTACSLTSLSAPAIVRRLLPHRLALAIAAVTIVLAAMLLAAFASFSGALGGNAVRTTLVASSQTTISVTATVSTTAEVAPAGRSIRTSLRRALSGLPVTVWGAASSSYLGLPSGRGLPNAQTHVISLTDLPGHAVLLRGTWPGSGAGNPGAGNPGAGQTVPVAVPQPVAADLGLVPGMTIGLRNGVDGSVVSVSVTGVFRALDPASPYWLLGSASGGVQVADGFAEYGPLITSPAVMASGRVPVTTAAWSASPDVAALRTTNLTALASSLQSGLASLSRLPGTQNETVSTGLPGLLSGLGTALVVARSQLAAGATLLLLIAGVTLALVTIMLSGQREGETALLRSRGASRRQLASSGLAEAGLLIAPAVIAGPLLGGLLLPQVTRHGALARSGIRLPVAFPAAGWLAAAAVAAGCVVVMSLPWLRPPGSPVLARAQRGRRRILAAASRAGADLALVVLAGGAAWQLEHYAAPVTTGLSGSLGIDPILVSAPALALAAGAVLLLRLLPLAVRLGDAAAARRRDILAAVAAWQISRRPLRQAGPVLLAMLAVATGVLAAAQWSSWQRSAQDRASFAVGADVRVNLPPQAPLVLGQVGSVTRAPGVTGSTPVFRSTVALPTGTTTLLALDAGLAGPVAAIRPDLANGSPASLLRSLAPAGPAPGVLVPGHPARLEITASLTAHSVGQPVLFVELTDALGISYNEDAGPLAASGAATVLTVDIAPGHAAAYPLRVTGFGLQYVMPARPGSGAVLDIESVRGAATMTGRFGAPFDAARPGGTLRPSATADHGTLTAVPDVTAAEARGTSLRVAFAPGAGLSPPPAFGQPPGPLPASLTVSADPVVPVPAAVTAAFAATTGQGLHSTFPVTVSGTSIRVVVASVIPAFPTISGASGGLVVDQSRLQEALAAQGALPLPVAEWWLSTNGGRVPAGLPAAATVTDRASLAQSLLDNPLGAAPPLAMLAIAATAVILAGAGFTVATATAGERSRDLMLLAALGATRRQLTRLRCLEQAALSVPAAVAGLALGIALTALVTPAVTLTATGAHPEPSVLVQIPLAWSVAVTAIIALIPVVLALIGPSRPRVLTARTEEQS
jgi:FtsX-like permease family